ncbi:MAG: hypothetical protein Q9167_003397 [Letrouitia subvulpina]
MPSVVPSKPSIGRTMTGSDSYHDQSKAMDSSCEANTSKTSSIKSKPRNSARCSGSNDGSDKEADDEDSDAADADEEDEEDEDDGDPDATAPSDKSGSYARDQTGLSIVRGHSLNFSAGEKRKRSLSPAIYQLDRAAKCAKEAEHTTYNTDTEDDDYRGVDLISDSEEDPIAENISDSEDPSVKRSEERMIISSEEDSANYHSAFLEGSPLYMPSDSSDNLGGLDVPDNMFLGDIPFFDDEIRRSELSAFSSTIDDVFGSSNVLDYDSGFSIPPPNASRRRVRFADPLMLPSEAATLSDSQREQSKCEGGFGRSSKNVVEFQKYAPTIEREESQPKSKTSEEVIPDDMSSSCGSSSGYETDLGETTDEEDMPATTHPQALLRRQSSSSRRYRCAVTPTPTMDVNAPFSVRWGPKLCSWVVDPTKTIALIDRTGKHINIHPAKRPLSKDSEMFATLSSSSPSSLNNSPQSSAAKIMNTEGSESSSVEPFSKAVTRPIHSSSNNMMIPDFWKGKYVNPKVIVGPPDTFSPFIDQHGSSATDPFQGFDDADNGDSGEDVLDVGAFVDFGDDSDEGEFESSQVRISMSLKHSSR